MYETYNENSFETARRLADFVRERRGFTVPVIIVENKVDCEVYDNHKREDVRVYIRANFITIARLCNIQPFFTAVKMIHFR